MADCPVCGLRCVVFVNQDSLMCPEHGEMSGLQVIHLRQFKGYEALIELLYWRAKSESKRIFEKEYDRVFGNTYDKILHGYWTHYG